MAGLLKFASKLLPGAHLRLGEADQVRPKLKPMDCEQTNINININPRQPADDPLPRSILGTLVKDFSIYLVAFGFSWGNSIILQ
jgi:hypothetical protein